MMSEILYQSDRATIYLGDCADVIAELPANSVDLIATDPPYGVSWQSGRRPHSARFDLLAGDDGSLDVPAVLGAATHLLKNNRHVYVFGYSASDLSSPMRLGGTTELIWSKNQVGLGNLSSPWATSHETITFGVHVKSKANRGRGDGRLSARLRKGSVINVPRLNSCGVKGHSTEKPLALMRMLIESSSIVDEVVFDPFSGSGSTLVAAIVLGRKALGVEVDPAYAALSVERVKRAEVLAEQLLSL